MVLLVEGLVEEDHSTHVPAQLTAACEEQLSVLASVLFAVLQLDRTEALADGCCRCC